MPRFASPIGPAAGHRRVIAIALLARAAAERQSGHGVADVGHAALGAGGIAGRRAGNDANMMQETKLVGSLERTQRAGNIFWRLVHSSVDAELPFTARPPRPNWNSR